MSEDCFILEVEDRLATITINRPEVLNALDRSAVNRLPTLLEELEARDDVHVIIVTGAGRAFSTGDDLHEAAKLNKSEFLDLILAWQQVTRQLRRMSKPTIAAIDGYALAGGLEIIVSCDLRVCSNRSTFGTPEVNVGVAVTNGASLLLSRIIGEGRAREMIFTGESINADLALQIGLMNRVVPPEQLQETARKLALLIASRSSASVRASKLLLDRVQEPDLERALLLEVETISELYGTPQFKEGIRAFKEKRKPRFDGA